jgi:hypothetical protein
LQRSAWFSQLRHSLVVVAAAVAVTEVAGVVDTEAAAWAMALDLVVVGASAAAAFMEVSRAVASTVEDFTEADFTDVRL